MKIENVVKKYNLNCEYICPKCSEQAYIEDKSLVCIKGHRYDFSKKGYIHLIANYKGTKYSERLFNARNAVFSAGYYDHIIQKIQDIIKNKRSKNIIDVGCGDGYYIKELKNIFSETYFYGIDNSKEAIETAVKNDKNNPYMLANLSNLPFGDNSIDIILNILTPANYKEFSRVLSREGVLIKIVPTKNYLKEIRDLFDNSNYSNDDTVDLIEKNCNIISREVIGKNFTLTKRDAENFLNMTPLTFSKEITAEKISNLTKITVELEIVVARIQG